MSVGFTVGNPAQEAKSNSGGSSDVTRVQRKYVNVPRDAGAPRKAPLTRTAFCRIKVFHYVRQNFGPPSDLHAEATNTLDVKVVEATDAVASLRVTKSMTEVSAQFEFVLFPTQNWKASVFPGDWVVIYMYGESETGLVADDGANVLLVGNVDRVARALAKDEETDKTTLRYRVSGRNFGKVFETTELFFDPYATQRTTLDTILQTAGAVLVGSPDQQVNATLDIFLGPGAVIQGKLASALKQWQVPTQLSGLFAATTASALGASVGNLSFNDMLYRAVDKVPGYKVDTMISPGDNGSLWDLLRRQANLTVNEVFVDESRIARHLTVPMLTMRPRPLQSSFFPNNCGSFFEQVNGALGGAYKSLQQLAQESFIELSPVEIVHEDVGKDDHSRFNLYWFDAPSRQLYQISPAAKLTPTDGITNPMVIRESVHRHGARILDQMMEFCQPQNAPPGNLTTNLLQAFIAQVYDQNYANHLYESGTIECMGVLEAELGKALVVLPTRGEASGEKRRVFYVEGYEHQWTYPAHWTTTFMVTHGQFLDDVLPFIDADPADNGQPDQELVQGYLSQSIVKRR